MIQSFEKCAASFGDAQLVDTFFDFLLSSGMADGHDRVWGSLLSAGLAVIDIHGLQHASRLLPLFEDRVASLMAGDQGNLSTEEADQVTIVLCHISAII